MSFRSKIMLSVSALALAVFFACTGDSKAKEKPQIVFKEQGPAGAIASINGKPITEEELIGDEKIEYAEVFKKLYDLRIDSLGQHLVKLKYTPEAQKANMPLMEYVDTKVIKAAKIADSEYDKFVKEKKIPKEQLNPQLKERIINYMQTQKKQESLQSLIVKLTKEYKVEAYFSKPNLKVDVNLGSAPVTGGKDAKVTIVEFSDFQCPFCSKAAATVTELRKIYGNKIKVAFKHYPLPMHEQARPAAEASMCVNEQGADKYWKYHDMLFANATKLDAENLKEYAKKVGANLEQFDKCLSEKRFSKLVQEDIEYGNKLGVRSTPTFFVNGQLIQGAQPVENFKSMIDEALSGS